MKMRDKLREVFKKEEMELKVQSIGKSGNSYWIQVATFVSARAIQNRLDNCFGFDGWNAIYRETTSGVICRLEIDYNNKKIVKEDGAELTGKVGEASSLKGGMSGALKRVASSGLGIGRYLYDVPIMYAPTVSIKKPDNASGWQRAYYKKENKTLWWKEPILPAWAYTYESTSEVDIHDTEELRSTGSNKVETELFPTETPITTYNTPEEVEGKLKIVQFGDMTIEKASNTVWMYGKFKGKKLSEVYKKSPQTIEHLMKKTDTNNFKIMKKAVTVLDNAMKQKNKKTWIERIAN